MTKPSFVIPSAPVYQEGILYGLEIYGSNFVPSPMSFTRATTATRVNADGLVELVPYNLLEYSQKFDNAYWTKGNATVTPNITTAPDGTLTAYKLVEDTVNTSHTVRRDSGLNSFTYSISVFVKKAERSFVRLLFQNTGDGIVDVNLNNGAILSQGILISSVTATSYEDDWYRIEATTTVGIAPFQATLRILTGLDATTYSYTGDGTSGIYIWGAQLVEGTEALPYLKTETRLNRPRVDFSLPGCPNLLLEPQRTNLLTYSEQFDNAIWTKAGIGGGITPVVTTSAGIAPNGTLTAERVQFDCVSTSTSAYRSYIRQNVTGVIIGNTYSGGFYIKAFSPSEVGKQLRFTVENTSIASVITITNDWQRIELSGAAATTSLVFLIETRGTFTTNATADVLLWGAQLEAGSYATSYIPTAATSVTRNADSCFKTNMEPVIGQTEGTLFVDFYADGRANSSTRCIVYLTNNTDTGNRVALQFNTSGQIQAIASSLGTTQGNIVHTFTGQARVAFVYSATNYELYVNGSSIGTFTGSLPNALNRMDVGSIISTIQTMDGRINSVVIWKERLTDDELEVLTGLGFNTYEEMANYYNYITQ